MVVELLTKANRAEVEREMAYIRLLAAAHRAKSYGRQAAPAAPVEATPAIRVRVLRALRLGS